MEVPVAGDYPRVVAQRLLMIGEIDPLIVEPRSLRCLHDPPVTEAATSMHELSVAGCVVRLALKAAPPEPGNVRSRPHHLWLREGAN